MAQGGLGKSAAGAGESAIGARLFNLLGPGLSGVQKDFLKGLVEAQKQQRMLFNIQLPVRRQLGKQIVESLRTGGAPGAQLPVAQRAVEAQQQAGARALAKTEKGLSRAGLGGTPLGQSILAQQQQQSRQAASQIPTNIAQQFIGMAPAFAAEGAQGAAQRLQPIVAGASAQRVAQMGNEGALLNTLVQSQAQERAAITQAVAQVVSSMMSSKGDGMGTTAGGCDLRIKENLVRVGTSPSGFGVYEFNYTGNPQHRFRGPLAQDVQARKPEAVAADVDGILYVRLDRIDVPLERLEQ